MTNLFTLLTQVLRVFVKSSYSNFVGYSQKVKRKLIRHKYVCHIDSGSHNEYPKRKEDKTMLYQFFSNVVSILDNKSWLAKKNKHVQFVQNCLNRVQQFGKKIFIMLFFLRTHLRKVAYLSDTYFETNPIPQINNETKRPQYFRLFSFYPFHKGKLKLYTKLLPLV